MRRIAKSAAAPASAEANRTNAVGLQRLDLVASGHSPEGATARARGSGVAAAAVMRCGLSACVVSRVAYISRGEIRLPSYEACLEVRIAARPLMGYSPNGAPVRATAPNQQLAVDPFPLPADFHSAISISSALELQMDRESMAARTKQPPAPHRSYRCIVEN